MKDAKGHGSNPRGMRGTSNLSGMSDEQAKNFLRKSGVGVPGEGPAHQSGVAAVGQKEPPIPVIYKKDADGSVFAAFPTEPGDMNPSTMMSYAHIGQHSAADQGYVASAKPASPAEYADLHKELQSIGYNPQPIRRMTQAHLEARRAALKG